MIRQMRGETDAHYASRAARVAEQAEVRRIYNRACSVYFTQYGAGGLIKIGFSADVRKRLEQIQTVCPLPLLFLGWRPGGPTEEARLHEVFRESRSHGEWFRPTEDLIAFTSTSLRTDEPPILPWPSGGLFRVTREEVQSLIADVA